MFKKILLSAALILGLVSSFSAQLYTIKSYTDDNGLAQNYVYSLSQNEQGFLYIGTGEGFSIFQGNRFKTLTVKDGLAENFVTAHITMGKKTVIGHFQGGISIYENNRVTKIKNKDLEGVKINGFLQDKDNNLLVYTQGKGIYKIGAGNKLVAYPNPLANGINHIEFDNANDYLIGTNDGLIIMSYEDQSHYKEVASPEVLKYKTISRIVKGNKQGNVFWVGVEGEGIYSIIRSGKHYVVNGFISAQQLGAVDFRMTSMIRDHEQNLWIGLLGEGIRKVVFTGTDKDSYLVKTIDGANGIENNNIQSIFEDKEGNMWFGTFGGGLFLKTIQPFVYYNSRNGLSNSNVRAIVNSENNILWIGHEKGLCSYDLTTNEIKAFNRAGGFTDDEVNCIKKSPGGMLWIGTKNNGVFTYNPATGKFSHFSKEHKLKLNCVNSIDQTAYGVVYIGTTDGLYIYNTKTSQLQFLTTLDGLLHNNVKYLFLDSQGRLWIASPGSPPYYYSKGKFQSFREIEGLKNYKITSYAEDRNGNIWIATEGDGCFLYRNGKFTNFTVKDNLKSNYVYGAVYDGAQTIWFTHKDGLSKLNIETSKITFVDRTHGNLKFLENNLNSFYRDNNTLFFGTTAGLVVYYNDVKSVGQLPITSICGISFDGKTFVDFNNISLKYKRYNVTISYKGIAFSDQAGVRYKYRLIGLDETWRSTSNDFVDYPKLSDGTYTFELLAANPQGVWSKTPVTITFTIESPLWKTWWFILIVIVILVLGVYTILQWRLKSLNDSKLELEQIVEFKTRELLDEKNVIEVIKNELEEKNRNITDSINYALRIQKAILPDSSEIYKCFPDSTIFYQPRDIVSGDFYWFAETDDYCYYAMVDCTGHGIPGAFMSLIGSTLLNEIIAQDNAADPATMLLKLNERIILTLKQDSGNLSRDGMDMLLCRFDKHSGKVVFSSAGRPLYHVSDGKLEAHRGGAFSIGGSYDFLRKSFVNHEISVKQGDLIVLFSDGYSDQFGEKIPKKFSSKRVKKLCVDMAGLSSEERSELIASSYFDWKGDSEQIDDVLFISIRV